MGLKQQLATLEYHEHPTTEQLVEFFKPMAYSARPHRESISGLWG